MLSIAQLKRVSSLPALLDAGLETRLNSLAGHRTGISTHEVDVATK